jgi:hypothetical protein
VLVLPQDEINDEHDDGIENSPDTYPADDLVEYSWETIAALFAKECQQKQISENHGVRQDTTCNSNKLLKESKRCPYNMYLQYSWCKLSDRHAHYNASYVLAKIVNNHPKEKQEENIEESQLVLHGVSLAPSYVRHYFIIDVFYFFKC